MFSGIFTRIINAAKTVIIGRKYGAEMREAPIDPDEAEEEQDEDEIFVPEKNVFVRVKIELGQVWIDGNSGDEEFSMTVKGLQEGQYEKENVNDEALFNEYSDSDPIKDETPINGWDYEYLPAGLSCNGKKPNMHKIKEWVLKYKLAGYNTENYESEYLKVTGSVSKSWDVNKKKHLVNTSWQDRTADKRPAQGTFSKNEHWVKTFPYTKSYRYKSWGSDQEDELNTTGKLSW
jgi:hypothetical protein